MTLTLTVQRADDAAPRIIEIEGSATLGRAPDCTVVLDDAKRGISRLQARIEQREDAYVLVDAGSNPTLLNDQALDDSHEAMLADEDRIGIGAYTLIVSMRDHTLMTRQAPRVQPQPVNLPETPEFEAPPAAPLIPDDWNATHDVAPARKEHDEPFMPDPLAATPLLRESGHFGGETDQALMDALSASDPLRDARDAPPQRIEHVSPEPMPKPREKAPKHTTEPGLLDALLDGLGIDHADVAHIPAATLARLIGAMLREATQGTMSVLRARSMTKRESRMAMTMIEERDNNPLKFFPDADRALTQMLGARGRGYLEPEAALRAAFRDIQAHELALIAGMRAALDEAMSRIDPAAIERSLDAPSRLDAIVGNRRARLWQRYVKTWEQVSRDAGDDFQQRFGIPFGRAYQAQLDALQTPNE